MSCILDKVHIKRRQMIMLVEGRQSKSNSLEGQRKDQQKVRREQSFQTIAKYETSEENISIKSWVKRVWDCSIIPREI